MTGPAKRSDSRPDGPGDALGEGGLGEILEDVYGRVDWPAAAGNLHVTAIAAADRATIALGPDAPASAFDRFVLGFARARVDALVTTGSILRAEPTLQHRYAEDETRNAEWTAWRAATFGRDAAPGLILLSRSGNFPVDHPAIEAAGSGFLWTSKAVRTRLGARLGELEVVVAEEIAEEEAAHPAGTEPSEAEIGLAAALAFARSRHGLLRIAIEAGPSATRGLYESGHSSPAASFSAPAPASASGAQVDELLLSLYRGALSVSGRAGEFASARQVRAAGLRRVSAYEKQEPSGVWSFERYRRAPLGSEATEGQAQAQNQAQTQAQQ